MKTNLKLKDLVLFLTIGTFTVVTTSSCDKDDDPVTPPVTNTITDKVVADASLSVLEAAVTKAELGTVLKGTGPFTVFAPDNDAFTASGITSVDPLSKEDLQKILLYHTIPSKILSTDVPAGSNTKVLTTNAPQDSIFVTKNANGVFVNGIKVKEADILADNGVIHKLERVLIPASGNVVETAIATSGGDNGLDSLVVAVVRADAAAPGLINTLSTGILTVFAPTNKAFRDLLTALSLTNVSEIPIATLSAVLLYHVVPSRAFSSDLANGALPMLANGSTTISLTGPTITGNNSVLNLSVAGTVVNTSTIIATNVLCRNGVVHVIDRVLLP
jgi:uncharacterized surface protein with fasciclin (FAS1) repeats